MPANEHQLPKQMPGKRQRPFADSSSMLLPIFPVILPQFTFNSRCGNALQQLSAAGVRFLPIALRIRLIFAMQLWAVMLVNTSELFVHQCTKSKVLDTLEDVFTSQCTPHFVRENLRIVIDAAARASSGMSYENQSRIHMLWRNTRPVVKLDEVGLSPVYVVASHFNIQRKFFLAYAFRCRRFYGQSSSTTAKHCTQSPS